MSRAYAGSLRDAATVGQVLSWLPLGDTADAASVCRCWALTLCSAVLDDVMAEGIRMAAATQRGDAVAAKDGLERLRRRLGKLRKCAAATPAPACVCIGDTNWPSKRALMGNLSGMDDSLKMYVNGWRLRDAWVCISGQLQHLPANAADYSELSSEAEFILAEAESAHAAAPAEAALAHMLSGVVSEASNVAPRLRDLEACATHLEDLPVAAQSAVWRGVATTKKRHSAPASSTTDDVTSPPAIPCVSSVLARATSLRGTAEAAAGRHARVAACKDWWVNESPVWVNDASDDDLRAVDGQCQYLAMEASAAAAGDVYCAGTVASLTAAAEASAALVALSAESQLVDGVFEACDCVQRSEAANEPLSEFVRCVSVPHRPVWVDTSTWLRDRCSRLAELAGQSDGESLLGVYASLGAGDAARRLRDAREISGDIAKWIEKARERWPRLKNTPEAALRDEDYFRRLVGAAEPSRTGSFNRSCSTATTVSTAMSRSNSVASVGPVTPTTASLRRASSSVMTSAAPVAPVSDSLAFGGGASAAKRLSHGRASFSKLVAQLEEMCQ